MKRDKKTNNDLQITAEKTKDWTTRIQQIARNELTSVSDLHVKIPKLEQLWGSLRNQHQENNQQGPSPRAKNQSDVAHKYWMEKM